MDKTAEDSVRLYGELLQKARMEIVDTLEINDNSFNVTAVIFKDAMHLNVICKYRVVLNGEEIWGEVKEAEYNFSNKKDVIIAIVRKVSDVLASTIVQKALTSNDTYYGRYESF